MKNKVLVTLLLLLSSYMAVGQNKESVVFLKDGTTFQGRISSQTDERVTVKKRKNIQIFEMTDVDKIIKWKDLPSQALKNSIGISFNSLVNSTICLNYERPLPKIHKKLSVGGSFSFSPGRFISGKMAGFDIAPMARWYITGEGNNYGFYVQLKFSVGYHKAFKNLNYTSVSSVFDSFGDSVLGDGSMQTEYVPTKDDMVVFAIGPSLGYQFKFKNPHWAIDMNFGLRYTTPDKTVIEKYGIEGTTRKLMSIQSLSDIYGANAYKGFLGIGSICDFKLSLNYRF